MSDCKNKDCKDCNEDYLQGMQPCVTLPELCVDGETCEETYNANCVRYTGSPVVCGTTTVLSTGMTTQQALISLANAICLSSGGGLTDLTALEQCCATNTTNITNLQTNLSIVNNTLTTISTQISTINTQITALQECCDNSLKKCSPGVSFPASYLPVGCLTEETIGGQELFYVDDKNAGMSANRFSAITPGAGAYNNRLELSPVAQASSFYVVSNSPLFGLSWDATLPDSEYYKSVQAILGLTPKLDTNVELFAKSVNTIVGVQGAAGTSLHKNDHIYHANTPANPLLMTAIGVQGVASLSNTLNIGGDFLSLWRGFQSAPNTAIRGKSSGSDLNSGYDIEVGLTTDANRTNVGGKIVVKSGAGGTNHGLKIDVTQALGVTYAVQLKDTTAAAGKFLKAVDSDGNAIWDTVSAGSVPPGVVSNNNINGTTNYVTKWIAADKIGDSQIQDNGTNVGIGVAPGTTTKVLINTSTDTGLSSTSTSATNAIGINAAATGSSATTIGLKTDARNASSTNKGVDSTAYGTIGKTAIGGSFDASGRSTNIGVQASASASLVSNAGVVASASGVNGVNHGIRASATDGIQNFAAQLQDGTHTVVGRYLRNMSSNGDANWANINITEVTNGLSSTLLGAPNGIATLDNNSKLVMSQMPISVMDYKGTFDPTVPSPALQDGVGNTGDVYAVTAAGTYTFGAGNTLTLGVGDWVIYNGTKWEKTLGNNVGSGTVTSVGLTVGTTGSDINISNSPITTSGAIVLNIPTAGATARGLLSSADWTTFNNKVSVTGLSKAYAVPIFCCSDGTNLIGSSILYQSSDGTHMYMGDNLPSNTGGYNAKFFVQTTGQRYNYYGINNHPIGVGIHVEGSDIGGEFISFTQSSGATGIEATATCGSSALPTSSCTGAYIAAGNNGGGIAIGVYSYATSTNLSKAYCFKGRDGSEQIGKFLKCVDTQGEANWGFLPDSAQIMCSDMTSVITADATTPRAIWVAPCNGTLTDAFASLRVPQVGGSIFTVLVKTSGVTIATLTFTNGATQYMSVNPTVTQTFAKGNIFELYISQVGDGSARSLLVTLNYLRT